jgi:hypothetical protein
LRNVIPLGNNTAARDGKSVLADLDARGVLTLGRKGEARSRIMPQRRMTICRGCLTEIVSRAASPIWWWH